MNNTGIDTKEPGDQFLLDLNNSKGRIISASLKLFAESGYNAVSVRDIAREVGIKDSSIYSHFSSKAEILETIITRFSLAFKASIPDIAEFEQVFKCCSPRGFLSRGFSLFQKRLEDPSMARTYFVLIREKFDSGRAAEAWETHRATVVNYVAEAFAVMMRLGMISARDPAALARLYEYPFFLMIEDYVQRVCGNEDTSEIVEEIRNHGEFFISLIEK